MKLGSRIKHARKRAGLTLERLSSKSSIGVSSLSEFENNKREPSISQLQAIASTLNRSVSYFLSDEPLRPEPVLWRKKPEGDEAAEIETRFLRLCEQYHNLEVWLDERFDVSLPFLSGKASSFNYRDAERLASKVRRQFGLGEYPAQSLLTALEETCGVKVFHLQFEPTGTAACTVIESCGPAILLNAANARWRRNFDLAHELFHVLTWSVFRGGVKSDEECAGDNEERFANAFASRLLLPDEAVRTELDKSSKSGKMTFAKLFDIARKFDVSVEALIWRMVSLHYIDLEDAPDIINRYRDQAWLHEPDRNRDNPPERPVRFQVLAHRALRLGEIALGRFAEYLGIPRSEARRIMAKSPEGDDEVQIAAS